MLRALVGIILIANITIAAQQSSRTVQSSHGTVNVILANRNGLVAVTDSMLSNDDGYTGEGQKLFIVDSRTICTIAGWYSNRGPSLDSVNYPFALSVPQVIKSFVRYSSRLANSTFDQKADSLAQVLAFAVGDIESISKISRVGGNDSPLYVTIAGIDNDQTKIVRIELQRTQEEDRVTYVIGKKDIKIASGALVYSLAGLSDVAESVLLNNGIHNSPSAVLDLLEISLKEDQGRSLNVKEMTQIARRLEIMTANTYPTKVGKAIEIATIEAQKVVSVDMPFFEDEQISQIAKPLGYFENVAFACTEFLGRRSNAINFGGKGIFFGHHINLHGCQQRLDNTFIFDSSFQDCDLVYDGSSNVLFDKSNILKNSRLLVLNRSGTESQFVKQFRLDHPDTSIQYVASNH